MDHKTAQTSGSAQIGLTPSLKSHLVLFARAKSEMGMAVTTGDLLFVTRTGRQMSSSNVATAVAADFMAAGTTFRAMTNRIRHSVVSIVSLFTKHN